jgi:hypothetical protein
LIWQESAKAIIFHPCGICFPVAGLVPCQHLLLWEWIWFTLLMALVALMLASASLLQVGPNNIRFTSHFIHILTGAPIIASITLIGDLPAHNLLPWFHCWSHPYVIAFSLFSIFIIIRWWTMIHSDGCRTNWSQFCVLSVMWWLPIFQLPLDYLLDWICILCLILEYIYPAILLYVSPFIVLRWLILHPCEISPTSSGPLYVPVVLGSRYGLNNCWPRVHSSFIPSLAPTQWSHHRWLVDFCSVVIFSLTWQNSDATHYLHLVSCAYDSDIKVTLSRCISALVCTRLSRLHHHLQFWCMTFSPIRLLLIDNVQIEVSPVGLFCPQFNNVH